MLPSYGDIRERAGDPDWFDERGVPRYGEFHPEMVTIYGETVALYVIGCQGCEIQLRVSHDYGDPYMTRKFFYKERYGGPPNTDPTEDKEGWERWREELEAEWIPARYSFGDPPRHNCVGDTMGSYTLACEQWWERSGVPDFSWERVEDNEVVINEDFEAWLERLGLHPDENPEDLLIHLRNDEDVPLEDLE